MFHTISPLDSRYRKSSPDLYNNFTNILSEDAFIKYCAKVEIALIETLQETGICPKTNLPHIEINVSEVYEEEERTDHQQAAIVNVLKRKVPNNVKPYVHLFATSFDIVDTAKSLQLKDYVKDIFTPSSKNFIDTMIILTEKYKSSVQIGRTHGKFAEPITFGFYVANFLDRFARIYKEVLQSVNNLYGKYSGAVGSFGALSLSGFDPLKIEEMLLKKLGLISSPLHLSTQIVHPETYTTILLKIAQAFTVLANLSDDFRHLMRSEIDELKIVKDTKTIGSSTMPHKINPKDFEQVKSLWKKFIPQVITFYMDSVSEHQRDLTNSASGRFAGEFLYAFSYSLEKLNKVLSKIEFNEKKALQNLEQSKNEIFAEPLYISLALSGVESPYTAVFDFINKMRSSPDITDYINKLKEEEQFKNVLKNEKFARVILEPKNYTGLCSKLAETTANYWKRNLN